MVRESDKEKLARQDAELKAFKSRLRKLEKEHKAWSTLLKKVIAQTLIWMLLMAGSGMMFGWKMSPETRQSLIQTLLDWVFK
jgi:hypothetical protein